MLNAYLKLIRVPNLVTAVADVLAASLIVMSGVVMEDYTAVALLALASCMFYAGGVVMNDVVDAELDSIERPERAIPSGKISRGSAAFLAFVLLLGGLLTAGLVNLLSFQIANLLLLTIVLYNGWAKLHHIPGSIMMGTCRALNFCLGLSLFPKFFLAILFSALFLLHTLRQLLV